MLRRIIYDEEKRREGKLLTYRIFSIKGQIRLSLLELMSKTDLRVRKFIVIKNYY
jgi:hypothetical protein